MSKKFHILYNLSAKSGEFKLDDLQAYGKEDSLCDGFVFVPINIDDKNRITAINIRSFDGINNREMSSSDLYFFWAAMGLKISELTDLPEKFRQIARFPAESAGIDSGDNKNRDKLT